MKQTINHQNPNFEQLPMQINVKIYRPSVKGPILADASVNLNGCFAIRGVQVKEGRNGPFVSMPSRQVKGEYTSSARRKSERTLGWMKCIQKTPAGLSATANGAISIILSLR